MAKYTQEQIDKMIAAHEKQQERQRLQGEKYRAKQKVLLRKAREAGIEVTDKEIEAEMKK